METKALTLAEAVKEPARIAEFGQILGSTEKANQFLAGLMVLANSNTNFQKCDPKSVIAAATQAASYNLDLMPGLGYAAVIPYGTSAQFQPMAKGLIQLFMRSKQAKKLNAFEVYKDEFNGYDVITGDLRPLSYQIGGDRDNAKAENIVGYGAYMELTNGFNKTVFWSKDKVIAHGKKYSKTYNNGPWSTNFDEMAKKTMLKQVLNYAPKDCLVHDFLASDQKVYHADGTSGYDDNPNPIITDVFTEEEMKIREALLKDLQDTFGISSDQIVASYTDKSTNRKATHLNEVPTAYIEAIFKKKEKELNKGDQA